MAGVLRAIDPETVRWITQDEDFALTPAKGSNVKVYDFNPGYLLYLLIKISDDGKGLGKYVYFKVQRLYRGQPVARPDVEGVPRIMYDWRMWCSRGARPGLLEYDTSSGLYVIMAEYFNGEFQIEEPCRLTIAYPRYETIESYGDTTALTNYGEPVDIGVKFAFKEINFKRVKDILFGVPILAQYR